ncbi:MAG: hypothetical protein ACKV2V_12085 [Blastocatellia bacterium]
MTSLQCPAQATPVDRTTPRSVKEMMKQNLFRSARALLAICWMALTILPGNATDLSRYRDFHLGASLPVIARLAHLKINEAKTLHQRPALIQELTWQADYMQREKTIRGIVFTFHNGALFRMVISYDAERTDGLTAQDMIDAVSKQYGVATRPDTELVSTRTYVYDDGERFISEQRDKVIARWEDSLSSINLIQPYPRAPFGLIIFARETLVIAEAAMTESARLDKLEAPAREIARQKRLETEQRARDEKARRTNKPPFRP